MKYVNLNDRKTFIASNDLVNELLNKAGKDDLILNFAYTDYGGTIFDKLIIEYFEKKHPTEIVSEKTGWDGKNAFIFGELAAKLKEESENYLLGFEDFEDYFTSREDEIKREGVQFFLSNLKDKYSLADNIEDEIMSNYDGGNVLTGGWDYSDKDLINYCLHANLLAEIVESE